MNEPTEGPWDYQILRDSLEAEGFKFDDEAGGVHCNWFWAQLGGTTPTGRPFYYRCKHGTATLTWTDICPDLSVDHAGEEYEQDPEPQGVAASLHRLITAASGAVGDA